MYFVSFEPLGFITFSCSFIVREQRWALGSRYFESTVVNGRLPVLRKNVPTVSVFGTISKK